MYNNNSTTSSEVLTSTCEPNKLAYQPRLESETKPKKKKIIIEKSCCHTEGNICFFSFISYQEYTNAPIPPLPIFIFRLLKCIFKYANPYTNLSKYTSLPTVLHLYQLDFDEFILMFVCFFFLCKLVFVIFVSLH